MLILKIDVREREKNYVDQNMKLPKISSKRHTKYFHFNQFCEDLLLV